MALGMKKTRRMKKVVFYVGLILIICLLDFPVYWMIKCSLTDVGSIMTRNVSVAKYKEEIMKLDYAGVSARSSRGGY